MKGDNYFMKKRTRYFAKTIATMLTVAILLSMAMPMVLAQGTDDYADEEMALQWGIPNTTLYANRFVDVPNSGWQHGPVSWADWNEITTGIANTNPPEFRPNGRLTRQTFATFLHRVAGQPTATSAGFADQGSIEVWATDAVNWASSVNIVEGFADNTFRPRDNVTRQQIAVMLFRYAQSLNLDTSAPAGALTPFADRGRVAGWATDAMRWAVNRGLIAGIDGELRPTSSATRAQAVAMLQRMVNTFSIAPPILSSLVGTWSISNGGTAMILRADGTGTMNTPTVNNQSIRWSVSGGTHVRVCHTPALCTPHTCTLTSANVTNHSRNSFRFTDANTFIWNEGTPNAARLVRAVS